MTIIWLMSIYPGTGKTTLAANLGGGLAAGGKKVLILSHGKDAILLDMLNVNNALANQYLLHSPRGIDILTDYHFIEHINPLNYDYMIVDGLNQSEERQSLTYMASLIIACTNLQNIEEADLLRKINQQIRNTSRGKKCINLIVPLKIKTSEWNKNSRILFSLAEYFSPEKIADPIPH